nr:MAG TPA: hypothetical protein [Caudoviricetes sp.]
MPPVNKRIILDFVFCSSGVISGTTLINLLKISAGFGDSGC